MGNQWGSRISIPGKTAHSLPDQQAHARVLAADRTDNLFGAVEAVVIDDDHLVADSKGIERSVRARQHSADVLHLAQGRNDQRQLILCRFYFFRGMQFSRVPFQKALWHVTKQYRSLTQLSRASFQERCQPLL